MGVFPRVWELIKSFKDWCRSSGWRARQHEDLVEAGGEYHNFLWVQRINPFTFKNIVLKPFRCAVQEGVSYPVVDISYMAWVLPNPPPEDTTRLVVDRRDLSRRIAIYDLSRAYAGEFICFALNETESIVFQEFERFLKTEYEIKLRSIYSSLPPKICPLATHGAELLRQGAP